MDPAYPAARLDYMLEHSGAQVLIGSGASLSKLTRLPEHIVRLDAADTRRRVQSLPGGDLGVSADRCTAGSLAYVIYTSGSTGSPKGVEVEHGSVVNFLEAMRLEPGMQAGERLLAVTPVSFDIHVLELYLPLTVGATVVLASHADCSNGERLVELLELQQITVMQATPATWRLMLGSGRWHTQRKIKVLCGGEVLDRKLADALLPHATLLWNMYGPTETTVWSACSQVPPEGPVVIGLPIRDTYICVLSAELGLQPIGAIGEICIGGSGLARGYRHQPELTAERFISIALPEVGSVRVYRTGDLGRWLANGQLECLGRSDTQVKIRGFRIELGEVQHALARQPGVAQCVVDAIREADSEPRLVAYVVPSEHDGGTDDAANQQLTTRIVAALQTLLPEYMLPSGYSYLQQLPLTANGKLDRARLPDQGFAVATRSAYVPPRNDVESRLCAIWCELLDVQQVGVSDDFFLLGGHSLLATRLISRMRGEFALEDVDIPVAALFAARTVEKLAEQVSASLLASRMRRKRHELMDASPHLEEGTL